MQFKLPENEPTGTDSESTNVVAFEPRRRQAPAEPLFNDAERILLRQMLREFALIKKSCPAARRITQEE